jgi:hypothetical protein
MLYGISGRDCTVIINNWSTYASGIRVEEYTWYEMPPLREISIPLSFFTAPVKSIGAETYATIATTTVPPRTISATFLLQSKQLLNPVLFPFMFRPVSGLPPFYKQGLRVVFVKPFMNNYAVMEIPEAVPTRWELQIRENNPATVSITWSFNTANLYDRTIPALYSIDPNDEFITIRSVIIETDPPHLPPHGVRAITFRINAPVSWRHRVGLYPDKVAYDFTINRWEVELQLTLTPDAHLWLGRQIELAPASQPYIVTFDLIPQEGLSRRFQLVPYARLSEGSMTVRVESPLEPTVTFRSIDFVSEVVRI